ncbi:hypothetical protein [Aquibium oceanicum]|uniref:Uncharacterized protein n=1 Tax=Aquibium oceanicum TaxID=1670800 RepID=A0A1L3SPY7_9HYPH|nr:hypothetical protein [Aquibium oceanicum]APH71430.1 hypothetical protein BSQ44_08660 [Aquibium oceanicum]
MRRAMSGAFGVRLRVSNLVGNRLRDVPVKFGGLRVEATPQHKSAGMFIEHMDVRDYRSAFRPFIEQFAIFFCSKLVLQRVWTTTTIFPSTNILRASLSIDQLVVDFDFTNTPNGAPDALNIGTNENHATPVPIYKPHDQKLRFIQIECYIERGLRITKQEVGLLFLLGVLSIQEKNRRCRCDGRSPAAERAHPFAKTMLVCIAAPVRGAEKRKISSRKEGKGAEKRAPSKYKKRALTTRKHVEFNSIIGMNIARAV